jgi:hypothetical protein
MSAFMVNTNIMAKVVTAILLNLDVFDGEGTCRVALATLAVCRWRHEVADLGRE